MDQEPPRTPAGQPEISIVIPVLNERENIEPLYERLRGALAELVGRLEFVFVDDGSEDGTASIVESLHRRDEGVRLVQLSRNFGKEAALLAGYDHARGGAVIVMDADLQNPPELLPEMISKWREGASIVDAVRIQSVGQGFLRTLSSRLYYWLLSRATDTRIISNAVDFRLLDARVVRELRRCREHQRFNRALVGWLGFRRSVVNFVAEPRQYGRSRFGTLRLVHYALDGLLAFSSLPLRLSGLVGLFVSLASLVYMVVIVADQLRPTQSLPGYASVAGGLFFLGGIQLLTIWMLGEYVGRIYDQSKRRPLYVVDRRLGFEEGEGAQPTPRAADTEIAEMREATE